MNSLESESSDDSSSLLDYDLVETNGDGQTPTLIAGALALQVTEGLVRELLLLAQTVGEIFHLLPAALLTLLPISARLPRGHLKILHQTVNLFQKLLRLGHTTLFHELLQTIHHLLQLVL